MEQIIASGQADLVVMGRALLADPQIPNKVMANRGDDVVKCLRCYTCMAERPSTQTRRCAVNPLIGREIEGMTVTRAANPRRVLVVGGGIAGLVAACTAAERGHEVTLAEQASELGGILRCEAALPFKYELYELVQTYARRARRLGVHIELGTQVDAAWAERFAADAVIVAVGSQAAAAPLDVAPGAEEKVVDLEDFYAARAQGEAAPDAAPAVPHTVIVLGSGQSGAECALLLAREGHEVQLVGHNVQIAHDANIRQRPILLDELKDAGVQSYTGLRGQSYDGQVLRALDDGGEERRIPGELLITATGRRARRAAADALRDAAPWVRLVGDCVRPAGVTQAVCEAYHAALDIA
jgi:NADPH-dependent 2,4-dienoyl-CoA reductase/sulfur reductase-like enzyme